jgi:uncharacterized membrane protein YeaQ/YmgE (transglycosylase-associated protein family)
MTLVEIVILLVIAAIAGLIGQALGGYKRGGILLAIILGFIGAYIGTWLARYLDLPVFATITVGEVTFPIIWAIIGAALLVALLGLLSRGRGYHWGITPPTRIVLFLSILLAVLALLVFQGLITMPFSALGLLGAAYLLLLLGNLVRGM